MKMSFTDKLGLRPLAGKAKPRSAVDAKPEVPGSKADIAVDAKPRSTSGDKPEVPGQKADIANEAKPVADAGGSVRVDGLHADAGQLSKEGSADSGCSEPRGLSREENGELSREGNVDSENSETSGNLGTRGLSKEGNGVEETSETGVEETSENRGLTSQGSGSLASAVAANQERTKPPAQLAKPEIFEMTQEGIAAHNLQIAQLARDAIDTALKLGSIEAKKISDIRVLDDLYRRATGAYGGGSGRAGGPPTVSVNLLASIGGGALPEPSEIVRVEGSDLAAPVVLGAGVEPSAGAQPADSSEESGEHTG